MENHILPFLWVHGESQAALSEEIEQIASCGISTFCVESRPHPDFCGPGWWKDFGFILEKAKSLGMRVFLLDDKHFPTGFANGGILRRPELRQKHIRAFHLDVVGARSDCKFILNDGGNEDRLIAVFAFPRAGEGIRLEKGVELTARVHEGILHWSVPKGFWRIVALFETVRFGELENYIDMLNPASCDVLLSEVYEPHYEKFGAAFGKTFAGFFSDEPRFSNGRSENDWVMKSMYRTTLGLIGAAYPWRSDLAEIARDKRLLVALWYDVGEAGREFRIRYMDAITEMYAKNFSERLGDWCRARGVEYTGHVTEDMGNHCRLGSGAGHFFRSMRGQSLAGIDVVLHQIRPGYGRMKHIYPVPELYDDPDFFHFTLAKLAVSAAALEPQKKGRALCEIFGAYGWSESAEVMRWLVDFMLVRGINFFVPHAFNPKHDDEDCPPYFYHKGENPQFSAFAELMRYTEKMCRKLSLPARVKIGVLYHAEAEWSGAPYEPCDGVCRLLTEMQIDFEIVPSEYLKEGRYELLILPYAECRGERTAEILGGYRGEIFCMKKGAEGLRLLKKRLSDPNLCAYRLQTPNRDLRVLRRGENYMIFNEGVKRTKNTLLTPEGSIPLDLLSGESLLASPGYRPEEWETETILPETCETFLREAGEREFCPIGMRSCTRDVNEPQAFPDFVGTVRYRFRFKLDSGKNRWRVDFGKTSHGVLVRVNGTEFQALAGPPYAVEVSSAIRSRGENLLEVELSTTLALRYRDMFSKYDPADKCALSRKIRLMKS